MITYFAIGFVLGVFVGANFGVLLLGLMVSARQRDDRG